MKKMPGIPEAAQSEDKARAFLESQRFADGAFCPKCGDMDVYRMETSNKGKRPARKGLWRCRGCKKQFTVTVGTIFEGSHIPLHKWLLAIHFMTASKKGISALQLHRMLGITRKAAWFMAHRIRYAMTQSPMKEKLSGTVEVDETFVGGSAKNTHGNHHPKKTPVIALIQRDGDAIAHTIKDAKTKSLREALVKHVDKSATIITDGWQAYRVATKDYKAHHKVDHQQGEYVRGDIYSNTAESFFALLKRGIVGTFHHVSPEHLDRYAAEFAFRWNTRKAGDTARALAAIKGTEGKRLVYKSTL